MNTVNRIGGAVKVLTGLGLAACCVSSFLSGSLILAGLAVPASAWAGAWAGRGLWEIATGEAVD